MVNGAPTIFFKPSRGLQQGDPLSPILFIIFEECLKILIEKRKQEGRLKGLKPSLKCAPFSHQEFVDDTIMGGEASVREAKVMKEILNLYTRGSGQFINWEKSVIFFVKTPKDQQRKIARIMG